MSPTNQQPRCEFCDGTGLWADGDAGPLPSDPCPLCEGAGFASVQPPPGGDASPDGHPAPEPDALEGLLALLPDLTPAERQHLYELLHARYDCRIYR